MEIKEIRKKYGLTQKSLSELTGIPKRTIENWEGGQRTPPEWLPKMIELWTSTHALPPEQEKR